MSETCLNFLDTMFFFKGEEVVLMDKVSNKILKFDDRKLRREPEHVINNILSQLQDAEIEKLKKKLKMATKDDQIFQERLVVQLKSQLNPSNYIMWLLKDIGREDLLQ